MAFSDETVRQAWDRAGGRCECTRAGHHHASAGCYNRLIFTNRGREGHNAWEAHHRSATGGDALSNCEILCWECYSRTFSLREEQRR
jgi:hypothetical protein